MQFMFITRWHATAFFGAVSLCVLCVCWEWFLAPLYVGGTLLVLKTLPLLLCLKGLWHGRLYVLQVTSMLVLLYMSEGVIRGMGDIGMSQYYAWTEFFLAWLCFFACLFHVSPYKKAYKKTKKQLEKQASR
jgi:uncharacterized membrane protein